MLEFQDVMARQELQEKRVNPDYQVRELLPYRHTWTHTHIHTYNNTAQTNTQTDTRTGESAQKGKPRLPGEENTAIQTHTHARMQHAHTHTHT